MYRRKQFKKRKQYPSDHKKTSYIRNGDSKNGNNHNKVRSLSPTKKSKLQRLSQIDKEISEIVFNSEYRNSGRYDELLLERWQLRFLLNL